MGSPDYLSPEQAACKPLDGRADIYSLGIVLYEMLTGRIPYKGDSYIETVMAHITSPLPDLPSHLKHYQALLDRMIAKKPGDRFSSAAEMVAFIDSLGQAPAKAKGGLFKKKPKPAPVQREFAKTIPISRQELEAGSPMGVQTLDRGAAGRPDSKSKGASKFMLATLVILLLAAAAVWQFRPYLEGLLPLDALPQITVTTRPAPQPGVTPAPGSEPGPEVTTPARAEPEPSPPVQSEDELEVNQYLLLAKVSLEADRLTAPARDNAYYYYQKVLALDPENVAARQGLTSVANRYADLADLELSKSRYAQAGKHVEKGLYVQADNPRLLTLQKTVANHLEQARVNAEISRYLLKANAAMDADKLTTPASDNAYFYYKKVLALDPGHKEAQQGITRIANRYADLAQWQIDRYNYDKAKLYVHTGLKVQPRNKRLLALRQRTDAVKDISNRAYKGIKSLFE
jgi:serine/threonine-protein kinase PpkA